MWKNSQDTFVIPSKFTLNGNRVYKIEMVNDSSDMDDNLGEYHDITRKIKIALNNEGVKIDKNDLFYTYLHELGHCFNYYYNAGSSEEFAQAFANFMYDYFRTAE